MIQTISFFKEPSDIIKSYDISNKILSKNTFDDWHVLAEERPIFAPPVPKTTYIDIPGGNGTLDCSESLTGFPVYNNREGTFNFFVLNGYDEWFERYSDIMNFIQGKKLCAVLSDDPNWFYEGRFYVETWENGETWSKMSINYNVNPFKWSISSSTDDWLWDPFNFNTGVITQDICSNIKVVNSEEFEELSFDSVIFGDVPVSPEITVSGASLSGVDIHFVNEYLNIDFVQNFRDGTEFVPDFIFYGQTEPYKIGLRGSGTVSIFFRVGRL